MLKLYLFTSHYIVFIIICRAHLFLMNEKSFLFIFGEDRIRQDFYLAGHRKEIDIDAVFWS
jgi:hypothetical protein